MKTRHSTLASVTGILFLLVGWGASGLHRMADKDAEHARFHAIGASINAFLASYCESLEEAFATGEVASVLAFYSQGYESRDRGEWIWRETAPEPEMERLSLEAGGRRSFGRPDLEKELAAYLAGLAAIDRASCKIERIERLESDDGVVLTVKHVLDGIDRRKRSLQDRLFLRWYLVDEGGTETAHDWRIARDELVDGIRVAGRGRALADTDPEALGIAFAHRRDPRLDKKRHAESLKFGLIEHLSGGLSAADFDLDGRPDLLFLGGRESRLYRNEGLDATGRPRFADVTAVAGLDGIDKAHVALFADFDNDGDRDLFVGRYLAPSFFFRNRGDGTFDEASVATGLGALIEPVIAATLLDYDQDGFLDLYVGVNGHAFETFPRATVLRPER